MNTKPKNSYDLRFLFWGVAFLTFLPVPYLVFGIANYGYGLSFLGVLAWLATFILMCLLILPVKFHVPSKVISRKSRIGKREKRVLLLSCLGAAVLLVENLYIRRPSSISLVDFYSLYKYLGTAGSGAEGLSLVGMVGFVFSGLSFYFLPKSIGAACLKDKTLYSLPSFLVIINMAMIGARQILMFSMFLFLAAFFLRNDIPRRRMKVSIVAFLLICMVFGSGYLRLGTRNLDHTFDNFIKLANVNDSSLSLPRPIQGVLVYIYGYVGNSPEVLSIFMKETEPNYIPFSTTNALIYRNLGKIFEVPSYENDLRHRFHDPFEDATGFFPRVWGTGNIQLYFEGGIIYIILWYWFLGFWFFKIKRDARCGKDVFISLSFFSSIVLMHQMIFPIRDSRTFLAFVGFLILNHMERKGFFVS